MRNFSCFDDKRILFIVILDIFFVDFILKSIIYIAYYWFKIITKLFKCNYFNDTIKSMDIFIHRFNRHEGTLFRQYNIYLKYYIVNKINDIISCKEDNK